MKILITTLLFLFTISSFADLGPRFFVGNDTTFKQAIIKNKISIDEWIEKINGEKINLLCLGETHKDTFRFFIADNILNKLKINKFFVEADDDVAVEILKKVDEGEEKVDLLAGADIAKVIRSVRINNPKVQIFGVDENKLQEQEARDINKEYGQHVAGRDGFIAQNILNKLEKNEFSIALYGSTHCARYDIGLGHTTFWHLLSPIIKKEGMKTKSVLLIPSGDYSQFDLHMMILKQKAPFVIPNTSLIDPKEFGHRWALMEYFSNYDVIIYF